MAETPKSIQVTEDEMAEARRRFEADGHDGSVVTLENLLVFEAYLDDVRSAQPTVAEGW